LCARGDPSRDECFDLFVQVEVHLHAKRGRLRGGSVLAGGTTLRHDLLRRGRPLGDEHRLLSFDLIEKSHPHGCAALRSRVRELKHLKLHAFGHIHEGRGAHEEDGVRFVNAASLDGRYALCKQPYTVIDL
jgi:hypothetical protein